MKNVKLFTAILLLLALGLSLIACGGEKPDNENTGITVTDRAGRTVTLEKPAEKIVSCYYVTTYSMLSLGLGERLVGIEKKAETRPIYTLAMPSLLELPAVGTMKEIDVEKIVSLSPDIVLLPKKLTDSAEALESLGIKTLIVNPETAEELNEMLRLIGKVCGAEDRAEELIAYADSKLAGFEPLGDKPSALFLGNSSYLTAAPSGMYQNDLITLSGGVNAYGETEGNYWKEISYETVLSLNPDCIIAPAGAAYTEDDLLSDAALSSLAAIENGGVYFMPGTFEEWDSPIPSGFLGVLWLRSILYPNSYPGDSFRKDVSDFYETFYGFTPTAEMLETLG